MGICKSVNCNKDYIQFMTKINFLIRKSSFKCCKINFTRFFPLLLNNISSMVFPVFPKQYNPSFYQIDYQQHEHLFQNSIQEKTASFLDKKFSTVNFQQHIVLSNQVQARSSSSSSAIQQLPYKLRQALFVKLIVT